MNSFDKYNPVHIIYYDNYIYRLTKSIQVIVYFIIFILRNIQYYQNSQ